VGIKERRERERSERKDSILQAAVRVYMEEGYHAATMDKIADTAELSRATLYLYFKTKDEIFVQAIVRQSEFFAGLLEELYRRREEAGDALLRELWGCFMRFYSMDPSIINVTLYFHQSQMLRSLPEHLRLELDRTGSLNYAWMCKITGYGIRKGIFRACREKTLAEFIWTSFLGVVHLENSKAAMGRKTHLEETWALGLSILEAGLTTGA
jgi:TetR/AcrR family transcriptional regulator